LTLGAKKHILARMEMQVERSRESSGPGSFRDRKKLFTREMIVRSSIRLFREKGFEATTVDEIAREADVSRRTFFRYFPSKESAVFPHQAAYLARFRSLLEARKAGEPALARVRRACLAMARDYMNAREEHLEQQAIIQSSPALIARGEAHDEEWAAVIARAFASEEGGREDAGRRARFVAGAIMGLIRAALREWYAGDCREDLVLLGNEALSLIEFGAGRL